MTLIDQSKKEALQKIINEKQKARLVVNTHSRQGRICFKRAQELLKLRGFELDGSYAVNDPSRLPEIVAHAKEQGCKVLIVGGGDGTLSSIVDYLAYEDIVLAVLPLGTGNGFARTLGLPLDLEGAVDTIVNGQVVTIDLGVADGDYFANIVSIGFNAFVVHNTPNSLKRFLGVFSYVIQGIKEIFRNRPFVCDLICDGENIELSTRQIIIANGAFYGVSKISDNARVDNGELIVCALDSVKKWDIIRFWFALMRGQLPQHESVRMFFASEVTCHANPAKPVDVDGELTLKTPITVSLARKALHVMAPTNFHE